MASYHLLTELKCTSRFSNLYKAQILRDGDSITELTRNITINSFLLKKLSAAYIKGTSFEFTIREEVDFEFMEFFTSIPKAFKIVLYNNTTIIWQGYLNTNQYDAPYKPPPNNLTFTASDGLGLLKYEDFTLTGDNSEFACIRHCIDKIDLQLNYAIAISMYEVSHTYSDRTPLEQTFVDCTIFTGKNCYEVLEMILKRYDAEITQDNNRWLIRSSIDKKSTLVNYDWQGVYDSASQAPDVLELNYPRDGGEVYPIGYLRHGLINGGKKFSFLHDYGLKKSLLPNYDFSKYTPVSEYDMEITDLTDWIITDPASTMSVHHKGVGNTGYNGSDNWIYLYGTANTSNQAYIHTSLSIKNVSGQKFSFSVKACPVGTSNMTVKAQVTLVSGGTTYYLTTSGWSTSPSYISAVLNTVGFENSTPDWQDIEINLDDDIPGDGTLTVYLIQYRSLDDGGGDPKGVLFMEPQVFFTDQGARYDPEYNRKIVIDNSTQLGDLDDQELAYSDAPDEVNNEFLYNNISRLTAGGVPTTSWRFQSDNTLYSHQQIFLKLIASRNRVARQKLTGVIKGSRLTFSTIIRHTYNNSREFEIYEGTWDMYEEKFDVTLIELLAFSDEDITATDILGRQTSIGSSANLTVATVTPDGYSKSPSTAFNTTVHIDNSGDLSGQETIDWKIVNNADETQSSGTHESGTIAGSDDEDHVIAMTTPSTPGTYYVKCKMANDSSWVTSSAIAVHVELYHIDTIADGVEYDPVTASFEAYNSGDAGTDRIYWRMRNSKHTTVASGYQDISFAAGVHTYSLTGLIYTSNGSNFDIQIGLSATVFDCTSNHFLIAEAP